MKTINDFNTLAAQIHAVSDLAGKIEGEIAQYFYLELCDQLLNDTQIIKRAVMSNLSSDLRKTAWLELDSLNSRAYELFIDVSKKLMHQE